MILQYKKHKKECINLCGVSAIKILPEEKPTNPFDSCGNCKYASRGFLCYISEGVCLRNNYKEESEI